MTTNFNPSLNEYFSNLNINVDKIKELLHGHQDTEKNIYLFQGTGNNGKTVLSQILIQVLGDESLRIPYQLFDELISEPWRDIAQLVLSKKLLIVQEMEENDWSKINTELLKVIATQNSITTRALYEDPKNIKINCKILFITNINPLIEPALNNRIEKIYFPNNLTQTMTVEERNKWYSLTENKEFVKAVREYLNN